MRKLGHNDRLVGPALMCLSEGIKPEHIAIAIACAIYYDEPTDELAQQLKVMRETEGIDAVLENVCKIEPQGELAMLVKEKIKLIKKWGWLK
jgi:mannitol-1-phosphate 5-dehydrogenase